MDDHTLFLEAFKGDEQATSLLMALSQMTQIYDDLIDRDKPVSSDDIHRMMRICLVDVPRNPFYVAWRAELQPMIEQMVIDWRTANELEGGTDAERLVAYVLRDTLCAVVVRAAHIIGGWQWALEVSTRVRRYVHDEPPGDYVKELGP